MEQSGSTLWWAGMSLDTELLPIYNGTAALTSRMFFGEQSTATTQLWENGRTLTEARH